MLAWQANVDKIELESAYFCYNAIMSIDATALAVLDLFKTVFIPQSLQIIISLAPVFLAVILATIFWDLWVDYVRSDNFIKKKYAVLELKLPKDTWKSPKAIRC